MGRKPAKVNSKPENDFGSQVPENGTSISCDQWLHVLDELNIGAFTVNTRRRVSSMNLSAQALMGMKEREAIGKDCREVLSVFPAWPTACLEASGILSRTNHLSKSR